MRESKLHGAWCKVQMARCKLANEVRQSRKAEKHGAVDTGKDKRQKAKLKVTGLKRWDRALLR
jgi:hypothetical protein